MLDWKMLSDMDALCGFAGGVLALSFQEPTTCVRAGMQLIGATTLAWLVTPTAMRYLAALAPDVDARLVAGLLGLGAQYIVPATGSVIRIACTDPARLLDWLRRGRGGGTS